MSQTSPPPGGGALAGLRFSLVGPGRVGASLAHWAVAHGAELVSVAGRSESARAEELAVRLGGQALPVADLASAGEDLLLVAVADPALPAVAARLAARDQAAVALHTAGGRDASALRPLSARGSAIGSLHPLKAFPTVLAQPSAAAGTVLAIDGDALAQALARRLAAAWRATAIEVPPAARSLYHFAATMAAGGVVTLLAAADDLARRLSLPPGVTRGYLELARGALAAAAAADDLAAALTGPAARGDAETFFDELRELREQAPEMVPLARCLARETLAQIARRVPLDGAQRTLAARLDGGAGGRCIP